MAEALNGASTTTSPLDQHSITLPSVHYPSIPEPPTAAAGGLGGSGAFSRLGSSGSSARELGVADPGGPPPPPPPPPPDDASARALAAGTESGELFGATMRRYVEFLLDREHRVLVRVWSGWQRLASLRGEHARRQRASLAHLEARLARSPYFSDAFQFWQRGSVSTTPMECQ